MSEINLTKRKEKCENCTKQVSFWIYKMAACEIHGFYLFFLSFSSQCNKKNSNDGAGSHQEKDEVSGQVEKQEYIQFTVKTDKFNSWSCIFFVLLQKLILVDVK